MGYNKENYIRIRNEYESKNLRAKKDAEMRAAELRAKYPEFAKIDGKLAETGFHILRESTKGAEGLEERLAALRETNRALQEARGAFLESVGLPKDYTSVRYECTQCKDTGFIGSKMCRCMHLALVMAGYESSGIGKLMRTQSFETFSLDYYKNSPDDYRMMTNIFETCKRYAADFSGNTGNSMVFLGGTGLGKTHMSTSIAKVLIERGFDVVYDTAQNVISDFEYERFVRGYGDSSEVRTDKYFNCDLLIMDDLGTEVSNQFTVACLYNIINTRINNSKSTIISTNLTQKDIRDRFGERITSRLFGEFMACRFAGKDVRLQKARQ